MGAWVGGGSIAATQMSAGTFVGTIGTVYLTGASFTASFVGILLAFVITAFVIAPRLRRYIDRKGALTFSDLIADRFGGKAPRYVVTILLIVSYTVFLSAQYQAGGVIFQTVFGIPFELGAIILAGVILLYTVAGGMTAVMRTDMLQQVVMAGGVVIGVPFAISQAGGLGNLETAFAEVGTDFAGWGYSWTELFGFFVAFGFGALLSPVLLMRYYAMRDSRTCMRASAIAVAFTAVCFVAITIIGMCMRVISPDLENADAAASVFSMEVVPPIVGALVLTAVLAALLSTVDSVLLVLGPSVSHDLYAHWRPDTTERSRMLVNRIATIVLGTAPLFLTFLQLDVVQFIVLAYAALIASTVGAPLVLGLFWRKANRIGAIAAMLSGFSMCLLWYAIGQPFIDPVLPGMVVNIVVMLIVSPLTARSDSDILSTFFDEQEENVQAEN